EAYSCFFSSRRRHTRFSRDWSSDVCSSDLAVVVGVSGGVLLGFVVDALIQRLHRRFTRLGAGLADLSRGHVPAEEAEPEPGTGPASPETGAEHCDERTSTPG